jgi:uncharacterized membrane protein YhiD involved in acid resistance
MIISQCQATWFSKAIWLLQGVGFVWLAMGMGLSFLIIIDKNILQLHLIGLGWDDSLS